MMMFLPLLTPGCYSGEGVVLQAELDSHLFFTLTWEVFEAKEGRQEAIQIIEMDGAEESLENTFTFFKNGEIHLVNSLLGEARGLWKGDPTFLSWEVEEVSLFKGFEIIRASDDPSTLLFEAEYVSDASKNQIKGLLNRII